MSSRRASAIHLGLEADFWTIASGAAAAQLAFALLVWIYGESPRAMTALMFEGTWGSAYGIGQVLFKATPLLFTGLAVHVGLRAGLFNVGAEGQLAIASLAVGAVGAWLPAATPWIVAVPLLVIVAAAERGAGVLVISADLDELRALCHRIVVIARGRIVGDARRDAEGRWDEAASNERLGARMIEAGEGP